MKGYNMNQTAAAPLTQEQIEYFLENGYLLASGLIPEEIARKAYDAMWRNLKLDPDNPETWADAPRGHQSFKDPDLTACYTPEAMAAVAQLGDAPPEPDSYRPPGSAYCINVFPTQDEWRPHGPHLDHTIKEHGYKTFPTPCRLAAMLFLNDVPKHGGGTLIWPKSHLKAQALARSAPEKFALMWQLGQAFRKLDIGAPVETTPKRGDILFYSIFTAHSGSMNVSSQPRFAMNAKW